MCQTEIKESLFSVKSGLANLIHYGKDFKNTALKNHVLAIQNERETKTANAPDVKIHRSCQKTMSNNMNKQSRSDKAGTPSAKKAKITAQSSLDHSDWKKSCIVDEMDPKRGKDIHRAEYIKFRDVFLNRCKERDDEVRVIEHRVRSCSDFIAAEACYHNMCRNLFNTKVKTKTMASGIKCRPSKDSDGFETLCKWMEAERELYTLDKL